MTFASLASSWQVRRKILQGLANFCALEPCGPAISCPISSRFLGDAHIGGAPARAAAIAFGGGAGAGSAYTDCQKEVSISTACLSASTFQVRTECRVQQCHCTRQYRCVRLESLRPGDLLKPALLGLQKSPPCMIYLSGLSRCCPVLSPA